MYKNVPLLDDGNQERWRLLVEELIANIGKLRSPLIHCICPLGRFSLGVAMSMAMCVVSFPLPMTAFFHIFIPPITTLSHSKSCPVYNRLYPILNVTQFITALSHSKSFTDWNCWHGTQDTLHVTINFNNICIFFFYLRVIFGLDAIIRPHREIQCLVYAELFLNV